MKFTFLKFLTLSLTTVMIASCNQTKETEKVTIIKEPVPTTGGSSGDSGSGGSGNNGDNPGTGNGKPLHSFNLILAGHQNWVPGTYSSSLAQETMPNIKEASLFFKSDSRLKVKLKVEAQPSPTTGQEYCYGRATGQAGDMHNYTKLKFKVKLRDVICNSVDPNNTNNCLGDFQLGSPYQTQFVGPVNVGSYSPVLNLGSKRNSTTFGTVIEVADVTADSTCQANSTFCPAEKIVREASCWHMKLFVSTDFTQDMQ